MGHELVRFDFPGWPDDADPAWQQRGKPQTNQRLLDKFRAARETRPIDLFFGYFYSSVVYPETIDVIRQSGVPTVNFSCNNVHQFDLVRDIAPRFDLCVVPERSAQADFRSVGAKPVRIQLAANPRTYRPFPEPRIYDVTFVGQRYADRADFLSHLYRSGVDVRAWGAGWQPHKRARQSSPGADRGRATRRRPTLAHPTLGSRLALLAAGSNKSQWQRCFRPRFSTWPRYLGLRWPSPPAT